MVLATIETRYFYHNHVEYKLQWAKERHLLPHIYSTFGKELLLYYDYTVSNNFPELLFNRSDGIRCSQFRISGLFQNGRKLIGLYLKKKMLIEEISCPSDTDCKDNSIDYLLKMTQIWFDLLSSQSTKKPGHAPILEKILLLHPHALSTEVPVWAISPMDRDFRNRKANISQCSRYTYPIHESFTGHVDLILHDVQTGGLLIADYKPEGKFLHSLPQVAIYGLIIQSIHPNIPVRCISFNKERAWLYRPEILWKNLPDLIRMHGNPILSWMEIACAIK